MTYQLDASLRCFTVEGNEPIDQAWSIWGEMQPVERVELAKRIGAFDAGLSTIKIQRATLNYIADHLDEFLIEVYSSITDEEEMHNFCQEHYKPSRFATRCEEYKRGVVACHISTLKSRGWSIISHHDERSGVGLKIYRGLSFEYLDYVEHKSNDGNLTHIF